MSYTIGQIVNQHTWTGTAWVPVGALPPPPAPPPPGPSNPFVQPQGFVANPLAGLDKAEVYTKSANFRAGRHLVEIRGIFLKESQEKRGLHNFIVETSIVQSVGGRPSSAKPVEPGQAPWPLTQPHAEGEIVSWAPSSEHPSFLGNVKGFCLALLGPGYVPPSDDAISSFAYSLCDPALQPAGGKRLFVDSVMILTKKEKKDFTTMTWIHPSQAPAGWNNPTTVVPLPQGQVGPIGFVPPPLPQGFVPPPPPGPFGLPPGVPAFRPGSAG